MARTVGFKETKAAAASKGSGGGKLVHPIQGAWKLPKIEAGSPIYIRLLTNNVMPFYFHEFVYCLDGKPRTFACTQELDNADKRPCVICRTHKNKDGSAVRPRKLTLGVAVTKTKVGKEFVEDEADFELLVDPDDPEGPTEKVTSTRFWIVSQGQKNFWNQLDGWYEEFDNTFVDRDYKVIRSGSNKDDTAYTFMPQNPRDGEPTTTQELAEHYAIPRLDTYDDDPDIGHLVKEDPALTHLINWAERKGTVEYYETHITGEAKGDKAPAASDDDDDEPAARPAVGSGTSNLKSRLAQKYGSSVK